MGVVPLVPMSPRHTCLEVSQMNNLLGHKIQVMEEAHGKLLLVAHLSPEQTVNRTQTFHLGEKRKGGKAWERFLVKLELDFPGIENDNRDERRSSDSDLGLGRYFQPEKGLHPEPLSDTRALACSKPLNP